MRIVDENLFIASGEFYNSQEFQDILSEIRKAIKSVSWFDNDLFVINPVRKGNGVVPIKDNFVRSLVNDGWQAEVRMSFASGMNPGPVDVVKKTFFGDFAIEWETGNISSSHRALNKIAVGIIQKAIVGGILILPVKNLAQYLTDRIGNYEEIQPYFPLYNNLQVDSGLMGVFSIEYDKISDKADIIPKGKDGNAKK